MYAAPVVWPVSLITDKYLAWGETIRLVYGLYPMAGVIEGFRVALLGTTAMPWDLIGMGTLSAVLLALSGAFYFRRIGGLRRLPATPRPARRSGSALPLRNHAGGRPALG